jgi:uncharacterized membrane protein
MMRRERMEAFSDGVFAVAITLLALNLVVDGPGHDSLVQQLGHQWPVFAAYGVSFFTIGIIWVNHHALFDLMTRVDRPLLFLNLLLLSFVVAIPFATTTLASYLRVSNGSGKAAGVLYAGVMEGMSISFTLIFVHALRRDVFIVTPPRHERRAAVLQFGLGSIAYLVVLAVSFVSPVATLVAAGLLAGYYMVQRTPDASGDAPSG